MLRTKFGLILRIGAWVIISAFGVTTTALGGADSASEPGSEKSENRGTAGKIEETAEKAGHKIEQGFKKAGEKIEKGVQKTGEGLEKAGKKIQQKLGKEPDPAETKEEKKGQQKPGN